MTITPVGRRTPWREGFVVNAPAESTLQVALDAHVVWSVRAGRDGVRALGGWRLSWPPTLKAHLRGSARVTVTDFADGTTYLDVEAVFDEQPRRVTVQDPHGHPLMVNKAGTLSRAIDDASDGSRQEIMAASMKVLEQLRGPGGVEAFVSFGALLGAVRTGAMIGHDCDVDLAYLSRHDQPVDVILESYRLQRLMHAQGWRTVRMSSADFKVKMPLSDGRTELIDVFAAFRVGETFYQLGNHSGELVPEDIVPTSTVLLDGIEVPAPARPDRMLAFLYGEGWRVPDPAFEYVDEAEGVRRLNGWFRGFRSEQPVWNRFYSSPAGAEVPQTPSEFALWAAERIPAGTLVGDIGCGAGRDSLYFAGRGHRVRSLDFSTDGRVRTRRLLRRHKLPREVGVLQLHELRTVLVEGLALRGGTLYARGLLDHLDRPGLENFWRLARLAQGPVLLEFATGRESRRRPLELFVPVDPDRVVAEAVSAGGRLVERVDGPSTDFDDRPAPHTTRLHLDFTPEHP